MYMFLLQVFPLPIGIMDDSARHVDITSWRMLKNVEDTVRVMFAVEL